MNKESQLTALQQDTLAGLSAEHKYLLPRYFYDDAGSRIFQEIMEMPEYYLTDCETEIFKTQKQELARRFKADGSPFNLIELGSGDGTKTKILLSELLQMQTDFRFMPVDISAEANAILLNNMQKELPNLSVEPQTGDYFKIMHKLNNEMLQRKIVLFLGSNIGNFSNTETDNFLGYLANLCKSGDQLLIGFDLKKPLNILIPAYDDPHGHTRRFNLNLLKRLNRELGANFNSNQFLHHTTYNPQSGDILSYLISTETQLVHIKALEIDFHFEKWEAIFMERSRKFDIKSIEKLAEKYGFAIVNHFFDQKKYFVDSLFIKK